MAQVTKAEALAKLLHVAKDGRNNWNHWEKDFVKHRGGWTEKGCLSNRLTAEEYENLPVLVASDQSTRVWLDGIYRGKSVWCFLRERLPFKGKRLSKVGIVFFPEESEIVHVK